MSLWDPRYADKIHQEFVDGLKAQGYDLDAEIECYILWHAVRFSYSKGLEKAESNRLKLVKEDVE